MFFPEGHVRVLVYTQPTDMRKSFKGLIALTKQVLEEDPLSGHLFVFFNRAGNYTKILYFDRNGYCIWSKRLAAGRFHLRRSADIKQMLNWTELKLLLEGLEEQQMKRFKRFG